MQFFHGRHFNHAGQTPGRPKINENDFPPEIGEADLQPVWVFQYNFNRVGNIGDLENTHIAE